MNNNMYKLFVAMAVMMLARWVALRLQRGNPPTTPTTKHANTRPDVNSPEFRKTVKEESIASLAAVIAGLLTFWIIITIDPL
jgi:hypothetical protein